MFHSADSDIITHSILFANQKVIAIFMIDEIVLYDFRFFCSPKNKALMGVTLTFILLTGLVTKSP